MGTVTIDTVAAVADMAGTEAVTVVVIGISDMAEVSWEQMGLFFGFRLSLSLSHFLKGSRTIDQIIGR